MRKIKPNIYAEAFGILHRKYEKEDCRKTLESILTKTPPDKRTCVCTIFEPVIEMMERCSDLTLNLKNPLYTHCHSNSAQLALYSDLFFEYFDPEKDETPLSQIPTAFSKDGGRRFIESVLIPNEELAEDNLKEEPLPAILHSELSAEDKLILINILTDGKHWIREYCLLLEETAKRISPILAHYGHLYSYLDQLFSTQDSCEVLFQRIRLKPLEHTSILPVLSSCNSTFVRGKNKNGQAHFTIFMGLLHCAVDFSVVSNLTKEQLCECLKCLSDPTKLSILTILKEKSTYQTDLARQLGLTTATISHHMNKLLQNNFVKYQFMDKKSYYEYQPEQIEIICEQLKRQLG